MSFVAGACKGAGFLFLPLASIPVLAGLAAKLIHRLTTLKAGWCSFSFSQC